MSICHLSVDRCDPSDRRGVIVVLTALLMVFLIGVIAFAIDLGYIVLMRTEIQAACDSAALAGAGALVNGTSAATTEARMYLGNNKVGGKSLTNSDSLIEFGTWNATTSAFTVTSVSPNGVRVTATLSQQPFFFAKLFGQQNFSISGKAVAIYQPRDIALVLDYSGSMCYDSQFRNMSMMGKSSIESSLQTMWNDLGKPKYGTTMTFTPQNYGSTNTSNSSVKSKFGMKTNNYPFEGGSWDEYIDYVQTNSYLNSAGYRCDYGLMTFLDYIQSQYPSADDANGLWAASEQPITALKDAVDVFLSYLTANSTDDQVAFVLYSYSDNTARLEQSLTKTYNTVATKVRQRQAGHYIGGTNISAGMTKGRQELQNNARLGSKKMMILMTDGEANLPTGNASRDKQAVLTEAQLCANANIPIVAISLGAGADTDLMEEVAEISGGAYFIVPGGQSIAKVKKDLEEIFGQVAADRPLKLVQ